MEIDVQPGRFVVAVSGGVDSMALLDILSAKPGLELIVAHFDHGIRPDSAEDRKLVQAVSERLGLQFVYEEGRLGARASEAEARKARYTFLERMRLEQGAQAIITAHHRDDVLETAILNLLRGTGRRGLTALANRPHILRPMLHVDKRAIREYAEKHAVQWREDSTNREERYLRNYIRHSILPRFDDVSRLKLLAIIGEARTTNQALDTMLRGIIPASPELDRRYFASLPHAVAKEYLAAWLRANAIASFDSRSLERLVIAAKIQRQGATLDIIDGARLIVGKRKLALVRSER